MKGHILLAESASAHPDGTISMLRAGLSNLRGPTLPLTFQATLIVRIVGEISDQGSHVLDLRCMKEDGQLALPPINGRFDIPTGGGVSNLLFGLQLSFQEAGRLIWYLRIDQVVSDELPFLVEVVPVESAREM